jgi:hypothetical protein
MSRVVIMLRSIHMSSFQFNLLKRLPTWPSRNSHSRWYYIL